MGNRFHKRFEKDRDRVCDEYHEWFYKMVEKDDTRVMAELDRIYAVLSKCLLVSLECHCTPKRCHVETIRDWLLARWHRENPRVEKKITSELTRTIKITK